MGKYNVQLVTLKTNSAGSNIVHQVPAIINQKTVPATDVQSVAEHFHAQAEGWVEVYNEHGEYVNVFDPVFKDGKVTEIKYVGP